MSELGMELDERLVYISEARFAQAGADGFSALFSRDEKPDAIVCGYDYIAFGLLNSADAAGISVPNQLSVIGFDDSIASGVYRLGLSTIGIDHRKRCNALVEMLIHRICKPDEPKKIMVIQSEFISRGTS